MAQIIALHGQSGPVDDPRITDRRDINRNWTWVAVGKAGIQYREVEYRSLANVPASADITRLTLQVTDIPPEQSPEFGVMIPAGALPFAFSRHERVANGSTSGNALTVIGYTRQDGTKLYLWVTEAGDALVTDRELAEYEH